MRKARVLIVDDSVVVRRLVTDVLASDPSLEVVGAVATGRLALAKIPQTSPDLITLDVEMPEMSGLETLAEIRKIYPRLPVIMFSNVTERGAVATLDALALGANDYVTKPANARDMAAAIRKIREELIPKIKTFCSLSPDLNSLPRSEKPAQSPAAPYLEPDRFARGRIDIIAIGVSTGGPNALAALLPEFPANLPVPVVIVQHMPPIFTKFLAGRLSAKSSIGVTEAANGDILKSGHAWIAPGDYHMMVEKCLDSHVVRTQQDPPENSCRPSVDVLFKSVSEAFGQRALAVIMTGMGHDGLKGCEYIRDAGGQVLAQDEASSVIWGMPGYVVGAKLANRVLPLSELGSEILQRVLVGRPGDASSWVFSQTKAE
ncbi:MAG: chemotaxis response regulator protein-glutamate methylesterase [Elusimicrobia bacterium]|nr:chemotaxis response regulator protein-glutamate methylesterase [Elusimicrobiota bacterium]